MDERRQIPRWEVNKEATVWMPPSEDVSYCVIEDIHLKGMRISCNKPLFQQQEVNMSFTIGDNFEAIRIEGQVSWSQEEKGQYVYGLSFNKIDDQYKDRIYKYITTNCYDQLKEKWWA